MSSTGTIQQQGTRPDLWRAVLDLGVIRRLVRDGLGCQCPDQVFEQVVVGRPTVFAEADPGSAVQLLVGNRLLVSLVERDRLNDLLVDARRLLTEGRELRDAHGLNRFRLVLVGDCEPGIIESLAAWARTIDDRLHVHLLAPEALTALLEGVAD
jgi:hypothetical protein